MIRGLRDNFYKKVLGQRAAHDIQKNYVVTYIDEYACLQRISNDGVTVIYQSDINGKDACYSVLDLIDLIVDQRDVLGFIIDENSRVNPVLWTDEKITNLFLKTFEYDRKYVQKAALKETYIKNGKKFDKLTNNIYDINVDYELNIIKAHIEDSNKKIARAKNNTEKTK